MGRKKGEEGWCGRERIWNRRDYQSANRCFRKYYFENFVSVLHKYLHIHVFTQS